VNGGVALFRLLDHVGLIAATNVHDARQQAARLPVHLDRNRLTGFKARLLTLRQPNTAVSAYLQPRLTNRDHTTRH